MAARRGKGGWSLVVFFGLWVGLALWWLVSGNSGTGMTIVKGAVLTMGLFGLAIAVVIAFIVRKLSGAMDGIKQELAKGMGPEIDEAATKLVDLQEAIFDRPHEYRKVDPTDFDRLDRGYYDDNRAWLEAQGFVHLADVENLTLSRAMPNLRTFLRVMAGDGGAVTAAVYQVRLDPPAEVKSVGADDDEEEAGEEPVEDALVKAAGELPDDEPPAPKRIDALEFETELEDGTFLVTNGLKDSDRTADAAGIDKLRLPAGTPREKVLAEHRRRVAQARAGGAVARVLNTFDEVMASQVRLQDLKVAHQRRVGYFNESELSKTGAGKMFGKEIAERAKQIYEQRRAAQAGTMPATQA
jgi:hypothetical protein